MNYSAAINQISDSLPAPQDAQARLLALCNRAYCYQQLGLHRKAIKVAHDCPEAHVWSIVRLSLCKARGRLIKCIGVQDYDEALSLDELHVQALLRKGKALWALNKTEVCTALLYLHEHRAAGIVHTPTKTAVEQEARNLWQRVCSVQNYAADLALVAEAHALLTGPEQPLSKDVPSPAPVQNGSAAGGQASRRGKHQVICLPLLYPH